MSPHSLMCTWIAALIMQFGASSLSLGQNGEVASDRVAAAHSFLVSSRAAQQLVEDLRRSLPRSEDYAPQFTDRLPDEAARRRFREAFDRIQREVMDKAVRHSGELVGRHAFAYARRFSVEELNAGTEFYRSTAGNKLLSSAMTLAEVLNGTYSDPEPERMQIAQALVDVLTQTDPFIAALAAPAQSSLPNAPAGGAGTTEREDLSPEDQAAARLKKLAAFYARIFTVDELNILIGFYRSPFAQRRGRVDAELQAEILNISAEWFEPFRAELETGLAEAMGKVANE
jgi:hypothetical protein